MANFDFSLNMDIYTTILDFLKSEYSDKKKTYKELEKEFGISYSYLRELINGTKVPERMSLEYFFKLFPHARLVINPLELNAANNSGNVAGINHGSMTAGGDNGSKLLDAIMADGEIPAEIKVRIFNINKHLGD